MYKSVKLITGLIFVLLRLYWMTNGVSKTVTYLYVNKFSVK